MKTNRSYIVLFIFFSLAALSSCERSGEASELVTLSIRSGLTDLQVEGETDDGEAREGSFSLLTYNIAGLPWIVSSSDPVKNTPLIGPMLNNYDVVLLQEDFWYHEYLAPKVTLPYRSIPQDSDPSVFDLHDGLTRFSKFRFQDHSRHTWTECAGHLSNSCDCLARKGFSSAMMTIGKSTKVRIYNVHFDAGESDIDIEARKFQFRQLADDIKAKSDGNAIIVAGDVNLVDTAALDLENFDAFIAETGLKDTCRELKCTDELFDKVLYRSSEELEFEIESRTIPLFLSDTNEALSDHKPVSLVMKWNKKGKVSPVGSVN